MTKDSYLTQQNIPDFNDFLKSKEISLDDERVSLLKEVWNQGIRSACLHFKSVEGVDHGAEETLKVS